MMPRNTRKCASSCYIIESRGADGRVVLLVQDQNPAVKDRDDGRRQMQLNNQPKVRCRPTRCAELTVLKALIVPNQSYRHVLAPSAVNVSRARLLQLEADPPPFGLEAVGSEKP
jgi:hypothetical protein